MIVGTQVKSNRNVDIDSATKMIKRMCAIPMFQSREEELRVARLARSGDPKARKEMVDRNYRLVISMSKNYTGRGLPHMDLIQEGCIGLCRAVDLFDPDEGNKFSTYAYWWVRQGMNRVVMEKGRTVRVPVHLTEKLHRINRFRESFRREFSRPPLLKEIASEMGMDVAKIQGIIQDTSPMVYSDVKTLDGASDLAAMFGTYDSTEDDLAQEYVREQLQLRLGRLPAAEAQAVSLTTGIPLEGHIGFERLEAKDIAALMGRTVPDVRRLRAQAMRKLRVIFNHRKVKEDLSSCF